MRLLDEVDRTVAALVPDEIDAASVALARLYAAEIDGAAAAHARAIRLAEQVANESGRDSALYERVQELAAKLSARTALLATGKQLQTLLDQMQAVRKGRPEAAKGSAATSPLGHLRVARGGVG